MTFDAALLLDGVNIDGVDDARAVAVAWLWWSRRWRPERRPEWTAWFDNPDLDAVIPMSDAEWAEMRADAESFAAGGGDGAARWRYLVWEREQRLAAARAGTV